MDPRIKLAKDEINRIEMIPLDKTGHPDPVAWKKTAIKYWQNIIKEMKKHEKAPS